MKPFAAPDQRSHEPQRPLGEGPANECGDRSRRLLRHGHLAVRAILHPHLGIEQAQKVIDFRHRSHGAFAAPAGNTLLNRHGGGQSADVIHLRLFHLLDKLTRVGGHAIQKSALPLRKDNIKSQSRLPRTRKASHHDKLIPRNRDREILQIVFPRPSNAYGVGHFPRRNRRPGRLCGQRCREHSTPQAQHPSQVLPRMRTSHFGHLLRSAFSHKQTSRRTSLRPEVDDPIRALDDFHAVLNHQQTVPFVDEALKGVQQEIDIVKMQACGRLIQNEKRRLLASFKQVAHQLEPLAFSTR